MTAREGLVNWVLRPLLRLGGKKSVLMLGIERSNEENIMVVILICKRKFRLNGNCRRNCNG